MREDVDAPETEAPKTPRRRRTKAEMQEARSMEKEDTKPKTDARRKARRKIIMELGAEDSPLRRKGRAII